MILINKAIKTQYKDILDKKFSQVDSKLELRKKNINFKEK